MNVARLTASILQIVRPPAIGHAHCDIPCGIYDPHTAQQGAETVEKMMTLIADLGDDVSGAAAANSMSRYVTVKEEHSEIVKHEVRIIWGDYFKPPHLEQYPDLHDKVWNIMKLAAACKQGTSVEDARALRAAVDEFAEMFWATKQG
ncbi:MAG: superoxide dismutase, Ni [Chloroflexi bacterium]|nr:superoxide dismutase, Ni [Chloroflexota bacterium]